MYTAKQFSPGRIGKAFKRGLLAVGMCLTAWTLSGCFSVNVHKEVDHPNPVVVVPDNSHP